MEYCVPTTTRWKIFRAYTLEGKEKSLPRRRNNSKPLTATELIVIRDYPLRVLPGDVKPLAAVAQVLVLDRQILDEYAVLVLQPVGERAVEPSVLVLQFIVAIPCREYVLVELDHGKYTGVKEVLGGEHHVGRVFPQSREHVGPVHREIRLQTEPLLGVPVHDPLAQVQVGPCGAVLAQKVLVLYYPQEPRHDVHVYRFLRPPPPLPAPRVPPVPLLQPGPVPVPPAVLAALLVVVVRVVLVEDRDPRVVIVQVAAPLVGPRPTVHHVAVNARAAPVAPHQVPPSPISSAVAIRRGGPVPAPHRFPQLLQRLAPLPPPLLPPSLGQSGEQFVEVDGRSFVDRRPPRLLEIPGFVRFRLIVDVRGGLVAVHSSSSRGVVGFRLSDEVTPRPAVPDLGGRPLDARLEGGVGFEGAKVVEAAGRKIGG